MKLLIVLAVAVHLFAQSTRAPRTLAEGEQWAEQSRAEVQQRAAAERMLAQARIVELAERAKEFTDAWNASGIRPEDAQAFVVAWNLLAQQLARGTFDVGTVRTLEGAWRRMEPAFNRTKSLCKAWRKLRKAEAWPRVPKSKPTELPPKE